AGLLFNDTDPDAGDAPTVVAVNGSAAGVGTVVATARGTVTVAAGGGFVYTPGARGDADTDSFTYTVSDGHGGTATAAVVIAINLYTGVSTDGGIMRVGGGPSTDVIYVSGGNLVVNGTSYALTGVTEVRIWGRGG